MPDTFTTTTTQGWGSRLGGSFKGLLFGLLLFLVAFPLLWWNEGRTVKQTRALNEGAEAVVEASLDAVDPALEGQLVHVSGLVTNLAPVADSDFGLSVDALVLRREVEMYQWVESQKTSKKVNLGGSETTTTEYSYTREWADPRFSDSSNFAYPEGHQNPAEIAYMPDTMVCRDARIGAYVFPSDHLPGLGNAEPLRWPAEWPPASPATSAATNAENAEAAEAAPASAPAADAAATPEPAAAEPAPSPAQDAPLLKKLQNSYYYGKNPAVPEIGDLRITFTLVPPHDISIVAAQRSNTFAEWRARNGRTLFLVSDGLSTAAEQFESAHRGNKMIAWFLRLGGFLLMVLGIRIFLSPLRVLADVLPFLGRLVGGAGCIVAFLIALPLTLLTIGLAWIAYRPLIGIPLVVGAVLLAVFGLVKARKTPAKAP